jgi:hypothetical protein
MAGLLMCGAAAAALSGCKPGAQEAAAEEAPPPLAALPLTNASAPQTQPGPLAMDLPYAPAAPVGPELEPDDGYAYLDRAYFVNDAFADAPPDYGFYYGDDEMPWVWRTDDGFIRMVEFLPYGVRYYYFEPGDDDPFLICDPDYDYAYADGDLVAVYDSDGALLPPEDFALHASVAGRELARAQSMFRDSGRERQPVAMNSWTAKRAQIASDLGRWKGMESRQPAWRTYHQQHLGAEQAHFAPERFRRAAETARIDRQIHDPDGADRALHIAGQAQGVARRAHETIAMLPRGRQGAGVGAGQTRLATNGAGGAPQGLRIERAPSQAQGRFAGAGPERTQRFAEAQTHPEPRAQFNVRAGAAEHGPTAFSEPHARAAQEARAPAETRAARSFAPAMASRSFQPRVEAPAARSAPRTQFAQAAPHFNAGGGGHPSGGGGHPSFGGGHPAGGGGGHPAAPHAAAPPPHGNNDKHH